MAIITRGISGGGGTGTGTSGTSGSSGTSGIGIDGTAGIDGTSGSSGSSGSSGQDGAGAFTSNEKLALELEMAFKSADPSVTKQLGYDTTTGNLTLITINDYDSTAVLFTKVLNYDIESNLIQIIITRISDSATLVKDLTYDVNGNLTIITSVHSP